MVLPNQLMQCHFPSFCLSKASSPRNRTRDYLPVMMKGDWLAGWLDVLLFLSEL